MSLFELPRPEESLVRKYENLSGVDFTSPAFAVNLNRSNDAKNVYRDYFSSNALAVQTRPGYSGLVSFEAEVDQSEKRINGVHFFENRVFAHIGSNLYEWRVFPEKVVISDIAGTNDFLRIRSLSNSRSRSFAFRGDFFIIDGQGYYRLGEGGFDSVADNAYIPTTMIASDPSGANNSLYQPPNLLTPKRINSFIGDGSSKVYHLDARNISQNVKTSVNGVDTASFIVDQHSATVTFSEAPPPPATEGSDNVIIEFETNENHFERITKCTIARVFDSRIFLTGNPGYKGFLFHSEFEDASYFRYEGFYDDGEDGVEIKALLQAQGSLAVIKSGAREGGKVFFHTPAIDSALGKVYPVTACEIALGCVSEGINFFDDLVYFSELGLKAVHFSDKRSRLAHKSTYVDGKLLNKSDLSEAKLAVWRNYLIVLVGSEMYLADARRKTKVGNDIEYEWFYFDGIRSSDESVSEHMRNPSVIEVNDGEMYFGTNDGKIYAMSGTNDDGRLIESYWCTPPDRFSHPSRLKSVDLKGTMMNIKRLQNSIIKVDVKTDSRSYSNVLKMRTEGFSFTEGKVNFAEFTFGTGEQGVVFFRIRRPSFKEMSLKFYSDIIDKPFGIFDATVQVYVKGYAKK